MIVKCESCARVAKGEEIPAWSHIDVSSQNEWEVIWLCPECERNVEDCVNTDGDAPRTYWEGAGQAQGLGDVTDTNIPLGWLDEAQEAAGYTLWAALRTAASCALVVGIACGLVIAAWLLGA